MKKKLVNYAISNNYTGINNAVSVRLFVTCSVQRLRELCGAKITVVQVLVIAGGKFSVFPRFGFKTKVCLCLKHYEEKTPANSACCFPKRSDSDKCSGCLVICPQRLVTVFETISPPKTSSSKICHGHLKTADNDDRIIGNKYYSSARKVSSREEFIAWVIPVSFPSQLRAELHRFPGLLSLLLPATTSPRAKQRFHQQITATGVNS